MVKKPNWTDEQKTLAAMITRLDGYVGRIDALLKELGLAENTLLIFASDNGASRNSLAFFQRSGALRAHKGALYEGGIRTPAIVRWPGKTPAGAVSDTPWYFADFLPTAAALAGVRAPEGLDGANLLPTLLGKTQPSLASRFLYWETHDGGGLAQAVRWGRWKATRTGCWVRLSARMARASSQSQEITRRSGMWPTAPCNIRWKAMPKKSGACPSAAMASAC